MLTSRKIAVIGAGFMGCVIATLYARHGYDVVLNDIRQDLLDSYRERALPIAESLAGADLPVEAILSRVTPMAELQSAAAGAFLVHEVVQEALPTKQELFAELDALCAPDVFLATNTSSFLLSEICRDVEHRGRVVGIHFVTPAHIVKAVEIVVAPQTAPSTVDWARRFLDTIEHVGVVCRERPGFLINRLQFALLSEVYRIMDEGLADRDDVDTAMRLSLGPRLALWGPLLTEDLVVSKTTSLAVTEYLHERTGDPNFAGRPVLKDLVASGRQGAVSGEGWYRFGLPYSDVVKARDRQLAALLAWLDEQRPLDGFALEPPAVSPAQGQA